MQWLLFDALGIERVELVTGGSLGGMVALEVAVERPRTVGTVVPVAARAVIGALARAWNHIQLETIALDPRRGLELGAPAGVDDVSDREDFETRGTVETLEHQGRKLTGRFSVGHASPGGRDHRRPALRAAPGSGAGRRRVTCRH